MSDITTVDTKQNADETVDVKSKGTRYFAIEPAAEALAELAADGAIDRHLEALDLVLSEGVTEVERAMHYLRSQGVAKQGHLAAIVVNLTHGEEPMEGEAIVGAIARVLAAGFPNATIGTRHGGHFLSYCRTGHSQVKDWLRTDLEPIPFVRKKKAKKTEVEEDVPVASDEPMTVEGLLEANQGKEGRKLLQDMAKAMGLKANGKTEAIAQRIVDATNAKDKDAQPDEAAA